MFKSILVSSLLAGAALGAAAPTATDVATDVATATPTEKPAAKPAMPTSANPDVQKAMDSAQACMKAIQSDCTKCVSGDINPITNRTCLADCFGKNPNVKKACPTIAAEMKCNHALITTCGSCVKPGFLGMPDIDADCFGSCYKNHTKTLLAACPLPAPIQKAIDCHKSLAKKCGDCVSGEHDVDSECLKGCWDDNVATLNKTCPGALGEAVQAISNLPSEQDIMSFISNLLSGSAGDSDFLSNLLGGEVMNVSQDMGAGLESLIGNLGNVLGNLLQQIQGGAASAPSKPQPKPTTGAADQQDPTAAIEQLLGQLFGGQGQQQQPGAGNAQGPAGAGSIEDFLAQIFGGALPPGTQVSIMPSSASAGSAAGAPADKPATKPAPAKPTQAANSTGSDASTEAINNALQSFLSGQQSG